MYALITDGVVVKYPYSITELMRDNPNVSFPQKVLPEQLSEFGLVTVIELPEPEVDKAQYKTVRNAPVLNSTSNTWEQDWSGVPLTKEEKAVMLENLKYTANSMVSEALDSMARDRGYDSFLSACTYATSTVPKFQQEGQYCVSLRDSVWAALYQIFDDVATGNRPMPLDFQEIIPELPSMNWGAL